jgi:hypothetical protein
LAPLHDPRIDARLKRHRAGLKSRSKASAAIGIACCTARSPLISLVEALVINHKTLGLTVPPGLAITDEVVEYVFASAHMAESNPSSHFVLPGLGVVIEDIALHAIGPT